MLKVPFQENVNKTHEKTQKGLFPLPSPSPPRLFFSNLQMQLIYLKSSKVPKMDFVQSFLKLGSILQWLLWAVS